LRHAASWPRLLQAAEQWVALAFRSGPIGPPHCAQGAWRSRRAAFLAAAFRRFSNFHLQTFEQQAALPLIDGSIREPHQRHDRPGRLAIRAVRLALYCTLSLQAREQ
jgi:hypothetical protein